MSQPKFGTAGAGDLFYSRGFKNSYDVPAFLSEMGLTAFEYQCGRGVRIGKEKANLLGENAKKYTIGLSIHAPYFISLCTDDEEKKKNNLKYFLESAIAARDMGATRIVFHPGGTNKLVREEAFAFAKAGLADILLILEESGFGDITFCPETMGMHAQLGDLGETIELCKMSDRLLPCVDFGHLYARSLGEFNGYEAFSDVFTRIENGLGADKAKIIQCHFSRIEYNKGGEKRHLTFEDTLYGPEYEPLMELLCKKNYTPTIICESAGTQAEDSSEMAKCYFSFQKA